MKKNKVLLKPATFLIPLFLLSACGTSANEEPTSNETPSPSTTQEAGVTPDTEAPSTSEGLDVALIVSYGGINDGSFNQGAWEGVVDFASTRDISYQHFTPSEFTDAGYLSTIELAVNAGASIIVLPGFSFTHAVYAAQDIFPDVHFALLDDLPADPETWETRIEPNTVAVTYAEEQAGFLAGYAAVIEGFRNLGFIGGMQMPPVSRFGHGFILGADYAGTKLNLSPGDIEVIYHYANTFDASPIVQTTAASWYVSGTEIIFQAASAAGFSIMQAAETNNGFVIGVDTDQSGDSDTVITSAIKGVDVSVYQILDLFFNDNFPSGEQIVFDASSGGVGLSMETSRFNTFTQEMYDELFVQLINGEITIPITLEEGASALHTDIVDVILP